jgi:hypothetical protein
MLYFIHQLDGWSPISDTPTANLCRFAVMISNGRGTLETNLRIASKYYESDADIFSNHTDRDFFLAT